MATLWSVAHPGEIMPLLMKVPKLGEGEDPGAIVSFEMEQMIMPRLLGPHVPKFVAAGNFAVQPYIVMERIGGGTLVDRVGALPLPYQEVAEIGVKVARALDDMHRQHVVHLDIKPANIMFRSGGEAVLLDFGLSRHDQLPDLMQEEFRLPFGTAAYMAPEQLSGIRKDPRSDIFALGVLLYFFSTGMHPFGESETMRGMRRRLWRDPYPPRSLKSDYPDWLQAVVLRCLEIEPAWRYQTAAQLAFDLSRPREVKLTARSERLRRNPLTTALRRRFNKDLNRSRAKPRVGDQLASAPIVAVAIDLTEQEAPVKEALRITAKRLLAGLPSARLACVNVLRQGRITLDTTLDEQGHNKHVDALNALKHWAEPLKLEDHRLTVHVLEEIDPASAILEFARANHVDQLILGARQSSFMRKLLGSVSAKVAAEAHCTVTVVRPFALRTLPGNNQDATSESVDRQRGVSNDSLSIQ
jgi:eukaryotic-like serine/threonine-protein kinase